VRLKCLEDAECGCYDGEDGIEEGCWEQVWEEVCVVYGFVSGASRRNGK
jgi:hypothetical protein